MLDLSSQSPIISTSTTPNQTYFPVASTSPDKTTTLQTAATLVGTPKKCKKNVKYRGHDVRLPRAKYRCASTRNKKCAVRTRIDNADICKSFCHSSSFFMWSDGRKECYCKSAQDEQRIHDPRKRTLFISGTTDCLTGESAYTGLGKKAPARFRECSRQVQAEVVSNSSNKIHQTWPKPFSQPLYL